MRWSDSITDSMDLRLSKLRVMVKGSDPAGGNSEWDGRTELPFDSAIPLLGIYPKELKADIQTNTCMQIFKMSLFKTAQMSIH